MKFLIWVVVNALAIAAATWLLEGITLTGASTEDRVTTLVLVTLIFSVINAVVGPVESLGSGPRWSAVIVMVTTWVLEIVLPDGD